MFMSRQHSYGNQLPGRANLKMLSIENRIANELAVQITQVSAAVAPASV